MRILMTGLTLLIGSYGAPALAAVAPIGSFVSAGPVYHGGGLNREGCHNDRKRGTYHCHRKPGTTRR
ncbi:hypothetical protein CLV77_2909 [Brevirhabdus pacifica]|nr:YHYH domain-containing protein [Brevirhabdus pacifica]PJJ80638.1 hypothetical protein CLV77_2909 [Brevirhabdus pacifica]